MITRVDHIDIKVADIEHAISILSLLGLKIIRKAPAPRNSVEMALEGESQVVFELHPARPDGFQGVHHIAFRCDATELQTLKDAGVQFSTENRFIELTGRTVSSFTDKNGLTWQLTD